MDLATYAVTAVLVEGRSVRSVAASTGRSKSWVARHVALYREGGAEALTPKRRGPITAANRTAAPIEDAIIAMRKELSDLGYDAGARTIRYHLVQLGSSAPALSTIHRVLHRHGFVTPQPQKRPRNSWTRFESDLPNETWQSDMTHWHLADERPVEIINFIDDYSRAVLCSHVVTVAKAADVVRLFFTTAALYGFPPSVLSDNGAIYTSTYRESHSGLEIDLAQLGIAFKHGKPYHPQTQGKVERYHQTLKKWLRKQPGRLEHRGAAEPDRRLRSLLQRGPTPSGTRVSPDARVANTRQGHPVTRRPTTAGQDSRASRPRRRRRSRHPSLPTQVASHQRWTRATADSTSSC